MTRSRLIDTLVIANQEVSGRSGLMVVSVFEEKCLNCPVPISGTIQVQADSSHTAGDFDSHHSVDQQGYGPDRVMKGVISTGTCRACGASFTYKVFLVMQLRLKETATQQQ